MKAKLYTKSGDGGKTSLFSVRRTTKFDARVAAVGDLDELSASLGLARVADPPANDLLRSAQRALYMISAVVSAEDRSVDMRFDESGIKTVEIEIDRASAELPELREFIFPGEAEQSCRLHMARTVARRAERGMSALNEPTAPEPVLAYLNRLSDLLFVLARQADQSRGQSEKTLRA